MGLDLTEGWSAVVAKDAAAKGYKFEIRNSNWNTAAGVRAITSLISEKPDVIMVQNPDVQSYAKLMQQAEKAGIHVIQVNMKTNNGADGYDGLLDGVRRSLTPRECVFESGRLRDRVHRCHGGPCAVKCQHVRFCLPNVQNCPDHWREPGYRPWPCPPICPARH
jgi:hypothetical protein